MPKGILYLVATPIGNLGDITYRAVETLKASSCVIAEDTRVTRVLLDRYSVKTRLLSFHKFNELDRVSSVIKMLEEGEIVSLVSDAGTPLVSDPGAALVRECVEKGFDVQCLPGPSSALAALVLSGFDISHFYFFGFLSKKENERRQQLLVLPSFGCPVVIFESPNRVKETLAEISEELVDPPVCVAKELTKIHEKVIRGSASQVMRLITDEMLRGEYVIVVDASSITAAQKKEKPGAEELVAKYINQGMDRKEAEKTAARELGMKKSDLYRLLHAVKK